MEYTTNKELVLPEYGRNIQNMVEIALQIEDRSERSRCARSIIDCMGNLFPFLRDNDAFKHKLWDHLAIMSNFKLDIDYPYEISEITFLSTKPDKIDIAQSKITARHYGRFIEQYIDHIANDTKIHEYKSELTLLVANYMKRCYYTWNQELIDDGTIFEDIYKISKGKIDIRNINIRLQEPINERKRNNNNNRKQRY